ncbi:MAG: AraC family transcriptional regulator [Hyphomonadaceae bacterium]|nr:AraC family transcriptional regulator [Hyphomonadaceae bacterium]
MSDAPSAAGSAAAGLVLRPPENLRAPDLAPTAADVAANAQAFHLQRVDRPQGPVTVEAGAGAALVARINLLARTPVAGARDGAQLKQCIAPDFMVVAAPQKRVVVAAHASQTVMVLHAEPAAFAALAGIDLGRVTAHLHGRVLADGFMTGLVERLFDTVDADARLAESLFQTLCLTLAERSRRAAGKSPSRGGLTEGQLSRLRAHVEGRLDRPLPIAELAALVGLSTFHFARAFKVSMGAAPATWIRLRRLTVAQRLLQDRALSVTDVAAAVGYDSPSRFSRAFRAVTGESPSGYRRRIGALAPEASTS